jgi:hypothetical protein
MRRAGPVGPRWRPRGGAHLRLDRGESRWGYVRIVGELRKLGIVLTKTRSPQRLAATALALLPAPAWAGLGRRLPADYTSAIESAFATDRLRAKGTKGLDSRAAGPLRPSSV